MTTTNRRLRVRQVLGLEAEPDTASIGRVLALQAANAASMQGRADLVGYDRGDPVHSLTGPISTQPAGQPAAAIAAVYAGQGNAYQPTPTYEDTALANPQLDPYNAMLLARLNRS